MKKIQFIWISLLMIGLTVACERDIDSDLDTDTEIESDNDDDDDSDDDDDDSSDVIDDSGNVVDHEADSDYVWDSSDISTITLNGSSIVVSGEGAVADASIVTISSAGNYEISGTLSDGQIIVDTEDESIVRLILKGVDINCSSNAPIYVEQAEKTMIVLSEGTENKVSDGSSYVSSEEDANAPIFSKDDLTIYGDGKLTVDGNYNDGITGKDGLIIASGNISVEAVDDGIRGKDYLIIKGGNIVVDAEDDGLKSDNDENTAKGYIAVEGGVLNITSGGDGIQAETDVIIYDGEIEIYSGGGSDAYLSSDASAKGIKSIVSTIIYDGEITVDAADDALHSDGELIIYDGLYEIAAGDDAIHAEYDLLIASGDINITDAYEGLESALGAITIDGGNIYIKASDDGINVAAGGGSSGGQRKSATVTSSDYALNINGGYIYIDCDGDGLDSNDELNINGGTMLVNSSSANSNSALDYDGACYMNGGFLLAIGSSQMAEAPGASSTQYSVLVNFNSSMSAGTLVHIEDEDGKSVLTYKTIKTFQSVVLCSAELEKGTTYKVYTGGSSTGTVEDGLYTDGTYSPGSLYTSFAISSTVTTIN
ncbi:carbohydrate-binding domain-containing protein [Saccharicrinis sp. GN24d3]|uniref:carbohydrate-binding domain-containing protein n=1 Tax=Saccharicrinis sp. GN24d3 TaxID=3458416 RepID=UPI004035C68B